MYLDEIPSVYPSTKTIDKLLLEEESEILEFKSSMLHPHKPTDKINALENQLSKTSSLKKEELIKKLQEAKNEQSRLILEEIIIAITSFLNSRGGTFLIGIEDNKKIIGIDYDYKYLSKNNWDGWLLYLKDKLKKYIKVEVVRQLNISYSINGKTIVRVDVPISPRYVFVKIENNENFYIRYFNSENLLKDESMVNYIIDRWKDNKIGS